MFGSEILSKIVPLENFTPGTVVTYTSVTLPKNTG